MAIEVFLRMHLYVPETSCLLKAQFPFGQAKPVMAALMSNIPF